MRALTPRHTHTHAFLLSSAIFVPYEYLLTYLRALRTGKADATCFELIAKTLGFVAQT